jgi:hypothetical protein
MQFGLGAYNVVATFLSLEPALWSQVWESRRTFAGGNKKSPQGVHDSPAWSAAECWVTTANLIPSAPGTRIFR